MNKKYYALLDTQIGAFLNPFTATTDAEAIRLFTTWVNDSSQPTNINKYPHHFSLFYIGTFDDKTAVFSNEGKKELIIGVSVQEEQEKKFTIKELMQMFETHMGGNVIDIQKKSGVN